MRAKSRTSSGGHVILSNLPSAVAASGLCSDAAIAAVWPVRVAGLGPGLERGSQCYQCQWPGLAEAAAALAGAPWLPLWHPGPDHLVRRCGPSPRRSPVIAAGVPGIGSMAIRQPTSPGGGANAPTSPEASTSADEIPCPARIARARAIA